jgi:ATP-dependent helicase HrpA
MNKSLDRMFAELDALLTRARLAEVASLSRRLRAARESPDSERAGVFEAIRSDIDASIAWVDARSEAGVRITYPEELPIVERREEIAEAIREHPVVVVCGETGSGKTTQLPKICLECGLGTRGLIGHTQPRRIAARSIARRVAEELGEPLGETVGFKVRFTDRTGPGCRIKLMTDGILLAEVPGDRSLNQYDAIIIDEAHERSLNVDFLLGYLSRVRKRRPDLKVIVTSATIDPQRFSDHFGSAPVIQVSGRTYPVEVRYRPVEPDSDRSSMTDGLPAAVEELTSDDGGRGDVLVFLPGEREIREAAEALRKRHPENIEILPLFSRLSAVEQDRVFRPGHRRRIILATNIAETSLTVPGIRYVVDPGTARISRYGYRSKIQRLRVEPVSRASADQRKGRCGRQRDGVCIRLYGEDDFQARPEFTDPEILRTSLASVILQMASMGLGHIEKFPFIDPPDSRYVSDGYRLLREIGAMDDSGQVTRLGRSIARFPLDPRLGRMVVEARRRDCLRQIVPVVAYMSIQDPRERPIDARAAADERHRQWQVDGSDFMGVLNLWGDYLEQRRHLSVNKQRGWCRENFLSFMRMREWFDVHQQICAQIHDMGWRLNPKEAPYEVIHRALLAGLVGQIGCRDESEYAGPRGSRFVVFPGSVMRRSGSRWVMAASLIQTSRVFAHTVARVEPEWIEDAAERLVRREYATPVWDVRRGHVTARERVSLYGLLLIANRRLDYGRVNPAAAREIFIRQALVVGDHGIDAPFVVHNEALTSDVESLEARLRRRDLVADEETLAAFFEARLPGHVYDRRTFERWRKKAEKKDPQVLFMGPEDVRASDLTLADESEFPDHLDVEGNRLQIEYRFEPGDPADGVTLLVPRRLLPMLSSDSLEWIVPGLLEEKVTAMIRALPKPLRRKLVPAPDVARRCLTNLDSKHGSLHGALARELQRESGVPVSPAEWLPAQLPAHLMMNIRLMDDSGESFAEGRDLEDLLRRYGSGGRVLEPTEGRQFQRMATWECGEIGGSVPVDQGGRTTFLFPALSDDGDTVSLAYFASRAEAAICHREGVLRLFKLACPQQMKYLGREFRNSPLAARLVGLGGDGSDPIADLTRMTLLETFLDGGNVTVRGPDEFASRLEEGRGRLVAVGSEIRELVDPIMQDWRELRSMIEVGISGASGAVATADLSEQLDGLVFPGWLRSTPLQWVRHYPRYLRAIRTRVEKLATGDGKLMARAELLEPHLDHLRRWMADREPADFGDAEIYRWMIEEFRVSLFDQTLGTAIKVSPQRLSREWDRIMAGNPGRS